jgi:hypothetical protein
MPPEVKDVARQNQGGGAIFNAAQKGDKAILYASLNFGRACSKVYVGYEIYHIQSLGSVIC